MYKLTPLSILIRAIFVMGIVCVTVMGTKSTAQDKGGLQGVLTDPSGALVSGADVTLSARGIILHVKSGENGEYRIQEVTPGIYKLAVESPGFADLNRSNVSITKGVNRRLDFTLAIETATQNILVPGQSDGVSLEPDSNASARILGASDLAALSDDPDQFLNELQTLAGAAAGPGKGQIYVNGFSGGQVPPKSAIKEIRINQNPYSAEFDQIGYGRIEVITKPCSDKFTGLISLVGSDSALNTSNPLVNIQPDYYSYFLRGDVAGPVLRNVAYFFHLFNRERENQNIVSALNPQNPTLQYQADIANPTSLFYVNPRACFRVNSNHSLSVQDDYVREKQNSNGVGGLALPGQAIDVNSQENDIRLTDTVIINPNLVNEMQFQWRRIRNTQDPHEFTPTVTTEGAFIEGGNNLGTVRDHQNVFEFQNHSTMIFGSHTDRFGVRLRAYQDTNYSTAGANGAYIFESVSQFLTQKPAQYKVTMVRQPVAHALLFDAALFYQDDWHWKPNVTLSYGLRYEGQTQIHDHLDWAPRLQFAWAPNRAGNVSQKTVIRAGYGWFYDRFIMPESFSGATNTPYLIEAIHQNGINQQSYVINNPSFYNPDTPTPASPANTAETLTTYYIDQHFHAALSMQGSLGIDQKLWKLGVLNTTYLYTQGTHQYRTNNITAPSFDPANYDITGTHPTEYKYEFQSGGVFKQHQIIVTESIKYRRASLQLSYTYNHARSDTSGVTFFPSIAHDPGLDYGRASFDIRHQLVLVGNYLGPYGLSLAPFLAAQSGTPYNITVGSDLTGNNQFNARPTYGVCGTSGVVSTPYGCLDSEPTGKGERIIPVNVATGPANFTFNLHASKAIGIGPRVEAQSSAVANSKLATQSKYQLTFEVGAINLFNIVNLAPPNGVLASTLFGHSQSLATGSFSSPTPGNRSIFLQSLFSF